MRLCIIFTILLLTSHIGPTSACGPYYPTKEAVRMHLINPSNFMVPGYAGFAYTSSVFGEGDGGIAAQNMNVKLWRKLCKDAAAESEIYEVLYAKTKELNNENSSNNFVKFLKAKGNEDILTYLLFAFDCGKLKYPCQSY